ncbi:MAG: hypothetical protein K6F63_01900 [Lachnospiraceae bacterium]|nr:hypothetical protein [Lachnospiraceae bacterium]
MSVIKEFILFAAGLVITVSLALISFNVYEKAADLGKGIAEREQIAIDEFKEYEVTRFDGSVIDGSKAISYIRKMYETRDIQIEVVKGERSFLIDARSIDELRKTTSDYYMSPLKKYKVSVSFDENDAADKIKIEMD